MAATPGFRTLHDELSSGNLYCTSALKGLAQPRARHSGGIALASSRRPRSMFAAAPVLFFHVVSTWPKTSSFITPTKGKGTLGAYHTHSRNAFMRAMSYDSVDKTLLYGLYWNAGMLGFAIITLCAQHK